MEHADVLERAPGRWSPSRLGRPPRWLLAGIAVLALAGGVTAAVWGGSRHGPAQPGRPAAQAKAPSAACGYIIGPISGTAVANGTYKRLKGFGCTPPRTGQGAPGGSGSSSSAICVAIHVEAGHPATQFGVLHRCYPGLS